ncbi:MAG: ACT domain-containing protein [Deltaproteobacteria bacterium]|nr:ACT domain-containing protein [Deltaproteobacteria bacterium]
MNVPVLRFSGYYGLKEGSRVGHFSLSVVGKDRPGIVAEVSRVLYDLGCNIEDSTCTILSGQFAMILVIVHREHASVSGIDPSFDPLRKGMGLTISLHALEEEEVSRKKGFSGRPHIISVYGADRPGIVHKVALELARHQVNVTDMTTQVVGSEDRPVYVMILEADIPESVDLKELDGAFERIRKELSVSISLRPIESVEL